VLNQLFNMANRERLINDNPCRQVSRTVLKQLPTWQNRERWLNKYAEDEEDRLFEAFNQYGEHLAAISRIVLNTGIRPPKEVLAIRKEHVNLGDEARYCRVEKGRGARSTEGGLGCQGQGWKASRFAVEPDCAKGLQDLA
jgi:integrase